LQIDPALTLKSTVDKVRQSELVKCQQKDLHEYGLSLNADVAAISAPKKRM